MSLIRFELGNKIIGYVRNQKCGSTSFMNYAMQALKDWPAYYKPARSDFIRHLGGNSYIGRDEGFESYEKELMECDIRIATYRDPVSKFISGYQHVLDGPQSDMVWRSRPRNLDLFIKEFDHFLKYQPVSDHCRSNTWKLGPDKKIYTHVLDYINLDRIIPVLEELCGRQIKSVQHRKQNFKTPVTHRQAIAIKGLMAEDYTNGWA